MYAYSSEPGCSKEGSGAIRLRQRPNRRVRFEDCFGRRAASKVVREYVEADASASDRIAAVVKFDVFIDPAAYAFRRISFYLSLTRGIRQLASLQSFPERQIDPEAPCERMLSIRQRRDPVVSQPRGAAPDRDIPTLQPDTPHEAVAARSAKEKYRRKT